MQDEMADRNSSSSPLQPTYRGYVTTTMDALILFEACLNSHLYHVPRRPHDRERPHLIASGNIFIYEENSSGIKRWTDGTPWSPSRILGNFLLYRELKKPFEPGQKKRAMKRPKVEGSVQKPNNSARSNSIGDISGMMSQNSMPPQPYDRDLERMLVGSLVDSYQFKEQGLIKKTISITYRGISHHLVSYYTIEDVMAGRLQSPTSDHKLHTVNPRQELIANANLRAPVDDTELLVDDRGPYMAMAQAPMAPPPQFVGSLGYSANRSMSMPNVQPAYPPVWGAPQYPSSTYQENSSFAPHVSSFSNGLNFPAVSDHESTFAPPHPPAPHSELPPVFPTPPSNNQSTVPVSPAMGSGTGMGNPSLTSLSSYSFDQSTMSGNQFRFPDHPQTEIPPMRRHSTMETSQAPDLSMYGPSSYSYSGPPSFENNPLPPSYEGRAPLKREWPEDDEYEVVNHDAENF